MTITSFRARWAAVGAAVAVTLGAGGLGVSFATGPAGAVAFVPITPCRLADTRPAPDTVGSRPAALGTGETYTLTAHGSNGNCTGASAIPVTATGLALNVTAIGATTGTFLTVWPAGAPQPSASSLNPAPGQGPVPNAVTTGLSADGKFNVYNALGSVNVFVDVVGYYTDHQHDDRYYTKAQVDARFAQTVDLQIGAAAFSADATSANWTNGCIQQATAPNQLRAGVQVPRGATITGFTGYFLDSAAEASLTLFRTTTGNVELGAVTSGTSNTTENRSAALAVPELVEANEYFVLEYDAPDNVHQLCGASIRYTLNGVGASVAAIGEPQAGTPTGQE